MLKALQRLPASRPPAVALKGVRLYSHLIAGKTGSSRLTLPRTQSELVAAWIWARVSRPRRGPHAPVSRKPRKDPGGSLYLTTGA